MKTGIELIAAERERQISQEGWTEECDDRYTTRELARAAHSYLKHYIARIWLVEDEIGPALENALQKYSSEEPDELWPFDRAWFKPKNAIEDLKRIGALVAAEIDRLNRRNSK